VAVKKNPKAASSGSKARRRRKQREPAVIDPIITGFGPEVRRRRRELELTIEDLAERAGLSSNYVAAVERGEKNPSLSTVESIAKGLGTSARALVTGKDDNEAGVKALGELGPRGRELAELFDTLPASLQEAAMSILAHTSRPRAPAPVAPPEPSKP
jgi:transcriptional regulator with XRE-family HTH domain